MAQGILATPHVPAQQLASNGMRPRRSRAASLALWAALASCAVPSRPAEAPGAAAEHVDAGGRRYAVHSLEKRFAQRVDESRVRTSWGHVLELAGEDETSWHYKVYRVSERESPVGPPSGPAPARDFERVSPRASATLRLEPFARGLPARGQWRDGFALADWNGDGWLDIAHGPARKGARRPWIFLGDGSGGWRPWDAARFPELPYDYGDAAAGDLDGDGALDLVLASHLRGLLALRGDGRGGFASAGEGLDFSAESTASFSSQAIRLLDFDGDGRLDVLALGEGPRLAGSAAGASLVIGGTRGVVLYRGLGAARFERREAGDGSQGVFGRSLAVGDFDGDGRSDFATASGQLGRRDLAHRADGRGLWEPIALESLPTAYVPAVAAADFDGDGRAELAVAWIAPSRGEWWGGIDVLAWQEGGFRGGTLVAEPGREGARALAAGDLDGDGLADLAALDRTGGVAIYRATGGGRFSRESNVPAPFGPGCTGVHAEVADLDGDGRGDLVAAFARERSGGDEPGTCLGEGGLAAWRSLPR